MKSGRSEGPYVMGFMGWGSWGHSRPCNSPKTQGRRAPIDVSSSSNNRGPSPSREQSRTVPIPDGLENLHEVLPSRARRMASSVVGSRLLFDVRAKRPAGPRGGARRGTSWSAPRRSHGRGGDRVCLPACESRERGSPREDADAVAWRGRRGAWRVPHDREVRVLAIPLDPAGRIRGDVIASGQSLVLGDRARDLTRPGAWHPSSFARGLLRDSARRTVAVLVEVRVKSGRSEGHYGSGTAKAWATCSAA